LRVGDVGDHTSEAANPFDFDQREEESDSSPSREPEQFQLRVMLEDLARMESTVSQIRDYSFTVCMHRDLLL
jgi:hypothetical protein